MGAILTTPTKSGKDLNIEQNNNFKENIMNEKHQGYEEQQENRKTAPFSKMNIVQECFPAFAGKDHKFFNEKVPSYWSKTNNKKKNNRATTITMAMATTTIRLTITTITRRCTCGLQFCY